MEHSLSKKSYRGGNGYAGKTATSVYDDVFGGPPKFGVPNLSPRLQDYNEIFEGFHASRGSSIPILDLPSVDDGFADYCFDVRSSRFDYSEVFGGFDAVDFAVSYEELFGRSKGGAGGGDDSSDDAWTPAQSESLSDESDPSASLERNQSLSNGDLDHSFGVIKQLKVSHNKASTKTEEGTLNGTGHISHFQAVPGFTAFTNETEPSKTIVGEKLPLQERSDLNPSMDFGGRVTQVKLVRKTKSHPSNAESARERYERNVNPLPGHEKQCSDGTRPQLSVSDFSLKTQPSQLPPPSRPPPALTVNKKEKDSGTPNSKLKASKSYAFEQIVGDTSPTYFDVEIDASSSAAVSAAAMKDAVEKAQAKLRSAKESMERKKEGLQGRFKVSNDDLNEREESLSKTNDKTSSFKNERMLGDFGDEDSRMRRHAKEAREKLKKTADSIEGQNQIPVTGDSVERKHGKERKSSPGSHEAEENVALSEEAQFYQMLGENYVRDAKVLNQNTKSGEHEKKSRSTVEVFEQQEDGRNIIDTADSIEWEGNHNLSRVPNGTCQWDENTDRLMLHQTYHQKEHLKKAIMDLQAGDLKEQGKKLRANQQHGEIETILKEADESEECENLIEIKLKEDKVDFEEKVNGFSRRLASDKRFKDTNENQDQGLAQSFDSEYFIGIEEPALQADNERRPKKSVEEDAKEKQQKEGIEREEMEKTQKDHERGVEKHYQPEKNEKRFKKAFELEETEKRSKVIVEPEGEMHTNKEIVKESQKQEKNQFNLEEACALEENATKQQNIGGRVENVNIVTDACENEEDGKRPRTAWSPEESKKTLPEGLDGEKSRKVTFKEEDNEKKLKATVGEETENMVQDAGDMVNFKGQNGVHEKVDMEENDCRLTSDEDIGDGTEGKNMNGSDGAYVIDDIEVPHPIQVSSHDRDSDNLETTQEILSSNGYGKSRINLRDCEREAEAVVAPVELSGKVRTKAEEAMDSCHLHHTESVSDKGGIGITKSNIENDKRASEMVSELLNTNSLAPNQVEGRKKTKEVQCTTDHKGSKDEFTCPQSQEQRDGEKIVDAPRVVFVAPVELSGKVRTKAEEAVDSCHLHHTESVSDKGGIGITKSNIENDKRASEMVSELLNTNSLAPNQVEGRKKTKEVQRTTDHKGSKDEFTCPQSQEQRDGEKILDAPRVVFEGKRRNTNNPDPKGTSQRMGREDENRKTTLTPAEKEKQERLKREREHEKDRLRKIEEERERQREREKDMMSIDRATLEARERAFVENRERVERATVDRAAAEVRQRALAEARERLEKACAEARERTFAGKSSMERSFAEKGSMEARLRAERASVERAAAQARERAEKAAAEKAALEARERGERSDADKLSASSRSSGMRQNSSSSDLLDPNYLSMGPYSTSRYSHTSGHAGGETESPQRCKARLERHRRTAERAQKALAEKNMRDLLVQKEQAERNRLAEGLDAEVRRWCSGKEGNLRALLSTLQYILGPDSGWQPVPLTDVITTVAVKKTYRKATLCVHPDKLQQRGATIHQKYICEKVFDLLKEAWNKFNSEER